jgi:glycerol-3-phosphate cytidylyltransferase
MTLDEAIRIRAGKKLVFTNGVFDILHVGHVRYLNLAREHGDLLFVGLNSDDSVRRLGKGENRPINPLHDRAEVLRALRSVDGVIAFEDLLPDRLIASLKPEVHVKGGDYTEETLPEAALVRSYGGAVVIINYFEGFSTTNVLKQLGKE